MEVARVLFVFFLKVSFPADANTKVLKWKITRAIENEFDTIDLIKSNSQIDMRNSSCQAMFQTKYENGKCMCRYSNTMFYIKDGKYGCYLKENVCPGGQYCIYSIMPYGSGRNNAIIISNKCTNLQLLSSTIWDNGIWNSNDFSATLSKVNNYKITYNGTEPSGKLIKFQSSCKENKQFSELYLFKVQGKASIHIVSTVTTVSTTILKLTRKTTSTQKVTSSAETIFSTISATTTPESHSSTNIPKTTTISSSTSTTTSTTGKSTSKAIEATSTQKVTSSAETIFSTISATTTPENHSSTNILKIKTISSSTSTTTSTTGKSTSKAIETTGLVRQTTMTTSFEKTHKVKTFTTTTQNTPTLAINVTLSKPKQKDSTNETKNRMIIMIVLLFFGLVFIVGVTVLMVMKRKTKKSNDSTIGIGIGNAAYDSNGDAQTRNDNNSNNKDTNKESQSKEATPKFLQEYTSLDAIDNTSDEYCPLQDETRDKPVPPRPIEPIYSYSRNDSIIKQFNKPNTATVYMETITKLYTPLDRTLTESNTETKEPLYFQIVSDANASIDNKSKNISRRPMQPKDSRESTESNNNDFNKLEMKAANIDDDVIREPIYFETVPDSYASIDKPKTKDTRISIPMKLQETNTRQDIINSEPLYSDIPGNMK